MFTAEQFQEHQEQLALMQKQQLEQIQQQASEGSNNTQVCVRVKDWYKADIVFLFHLVTLFSFIFSL